MIPSPRGRTIRYHIGRFKVVTAVHERWITLNMSIVDSSRAEDVPSEMIAKFAQCNEVVLDRTTLNKTYYNITNTSQ